MNKNLTARLGPLRCSELSAISLILVQRSVAKPSVDNSPPKLQDQKPFNPKQAPQ